MTSIEVLLRALTEREQPYRERRPAFDPDQRLGTDQLARRAEQRMPMRHGTHRDAVNLIDRPHQQLTLDPVDAVAVGAESVVADDQGKGNRIDCEPPLPIGLIALGQRTTQSIDTRHGSELLMFLGRSLGAMIRRWLIDPPRPTS